MPEESAAPNPLDTWRQFITDSERQWNSFFRDVLGTEQASAAMNTWVEASLTVQRMVADNLERLYTTFNIPSHSDLIALGERMKAIEDSLARIESLVQTQGSATIPAGAATRPAPRRTKMPAALANANGASAS